MPETPVKPATPRQLVFECKVKDCDATLELRTQGNRDKNGAHRWTGLVASLYAKAKKGSVRPAVRIAFAMADLTECHLEHWTLDDALWIGAVAFDVDRKEIPRLTEFLTSLGVAD